MSKKPKPRIKVLRNGEPVDPHSTQIRSDQSEKLKKERPPAIRHTSPDAPIKVNNKTPEIIYSAGKNLKCDQCEKTNPTKRMFRYRNSSRGQILLCERCDEQAEVRSFYKLDALDFPRKEYKVD
jgi:hypothetical protein